MYLGHTMESIVNSVKKVYSNNLFVVKYFHIKE